METISRFYAHAGKIAITIGAGDTTYITTDQAEMIGAKLSELASQVKNGNHSTTVEVPATEEQMKRMREDAPEIYKIIRCYRNGNSPRTIARSVTIFEAQEHCSDPSTSNTKYFDGYELK